MTQQETRRQTPHGDTSADDRREALDAVYAFARTMDARDWTGYRAVFAPTIELDYSFFHPEQKGPITAGDWADNVERRLSRLDATQHAMSNPQAVVTGDRAEVRVYAQAHQVVDIDGAQAWCLVAGEYTFGLARDGAAWLIDAIALRPFFTTGDPRVLDVARR